MLRRKIPYEIKGYKSTMFFGLTTRQLICVAIAAVLVIPTVLIGKDILTSDTLGWIIMIEAVPLAAVGWLSYNDMPLEQIAVKFFYFYFGTQKRKWQWKYPESLIHDFEVQMDYEDYKEIRDKEISSEKLRLEEEKKAKKLNKKQSKKEKRRKKDA